jgi:pimeloyl-ACP methyl ester carboxylesterase
MLPVLAQAGFRVYAPDRPGYGHADPRPEYAPVNGWKSHAEFVGRFADALCLDKFYIGGNSQGAHNAMYYMVNNPERIIAAALIATAGLPAMVGVDPAKLVPGGFSYPPFDGTKDSMLTLMTSIIYRKDAVSDDLLEMRTRSGRIQEASLAAFRAGMASKDPNLATWTNISQRLPKLTMPIIYLQGLQDVTVKMENAYQAEPYLPSWQFFYVDECGHQGQTDQPELFNQVFLEFFRDGKVSRATADKAGVSKNRAENPALVG